MMQHNELLTLLGFRLSDPFFLSVLIGFMICTALSVYLWRLHLNLKHHIATLTTNVTNADKQFDSIAKELAELRQGTLGIGRKVLVLEKSLQQQKIKLNENLEQDTGSRLYTRAAKMVALGADINELMEECELPKAEAELLLHIHKK